MHPLVVHFPIALLIVAFLLELLTLRGKRFDLRPGIRWLVFIGAGSALISVVVGLMLAYGANYPESTLNYHQWSGIATAAAALLAAGLLYRADASGRTKDRNLYRGCLTLAVLLLAFAGHFGASLTHGSDYLTDALPWNYDTVAREESGEFLTEVAEHRAMGTLEETHLNELNLEVRRVFAHSCYRCHASDDEAEGGLELDSKDGVMLGGDGGPIVTPGRPDDSELMRRLLLPGNHDEAMPQRGRALFSEEVELIRTWIELGAHWSDEDVGIFREAEMALSKPEPPRTNSDLENPIDRFVDEYFEARGIRWPEPVDDAVFMRRVHLDVIGLLPEPEELSEFVADTSPDKRDRLIDSLLNREHDYAQHSLSFWNDLLRNAYTGTGFITGGRKQITDWLYDALENNKPYNRMISELVAPDETSEGFIRGIEWRGDVNASQTTEMQAAQNVSQSLLGVNMKCASCHDSFVSNLTLDQAYSFAAVFSDNELPIERCDVPTGEFAEPGFLYNDLGEIDKDLPVEERLKQLADILTKEENGRLYRTIANRYWKRLMGKGLVEPVDEMDREPWSQDLLDWLAADLIDHDYDLKYLMASILRSRAYQLPSVGVSSEEAGATSEEFVFTGPLRKRLSAEQFADALSQLAAPVYGSVAFDPFGNQTAEASWIWFDAREDGRPAFAPPGKYYFRRAFDLPADSEIREARLLVSVDEAYRLYLNGASIAHGNDWRQVERIDVTDRLNAGENLLAVEAEKGGTTAEPAGVLLNLEIAFAGGEQREVISDTQWKVVNGHPGPGWETHGFDDGEWDSVRAFGSSTANTHWGRLVNFTHDPAGNRLEFVRASLVPKDPFQTAMGRPAREIVISDRDADPTLLQALELTNGKVVNEILARGAERWIREFGHDPDEMIRRIYLRALSRTPTQHESRIAGELLSPEPAGDAVQDLLWAVIMKHEFQSIY